MCSRAHVSLGSARKFRALLAYQKMLGAALWLCLGGLGFAMTANPNLVEVKQPDGAGISLRMRGDEYFHWLEDVKGYTVMQDKAGKYVYAQLAQDGTLAATELVVGRAAPDAAGLKKGLQVPKTVQVQQSAALRQSMTSQAVDGPQRINPTGTVKNLVVLCRFSNHTAAQGRTQAEYDTMFNTVGGSPTLAPTGSVRDYYTEASYGTMTLQSTVVAWLTLPQTEAYYAAGNDGLGTYPQNAQRMVEDALNLVDPLVNFTQFDQDNDGFVDAIDIIHSGYAAETGGGGGNWIWSHKWALPSNWSSAENNGSGVRVKVRDYHTEPALWGTSGTDILRIGVICHETGHFFGLPDLYDTDNTSEGIGSYCLMANSWGFDFTQQHPPHFSAWCKIQLGWVTPTVISSGNFTAPRVETNATIFKITSGYPAGEYLLVENRQPFGFESNMPQGGLCIWHVDEAKSGNTSEGFPGQAGWPGNNNHYKVALLQADGAYNMEHNVNRGDAGDVFRSGGVAAISDATVPSTNRYQGGTVAASGNRIESISVSGASMTFTLNPAATDPPVITSPLTAAGNTGATFTYQITATNGPTSFSATGLPAGLTFTAGTGIITGSPTVAGTSNITLGATNGIGTGNATLVLTITDLNTGLANALDTPGRSFTISGNANWFPQTATTHDGVDAIQSGDITDSQASTVETVITGPANVSWRTKVSSESSYDFLKVFLDNVQQLSISGEVDWTLQTLAIPTGAHTLRWSYTKDGSVSSGGDAGWVDELTITPITLPPVISSASAVAGYMGLAVNYQITATNAPSSYGATGLPAWLTITPTTGLVSGTPPAPATVQFTVSATNSQGTGSQLVTLTVTDPSASLPEALDAPGLTFTASGEAPWSKQTTVTYDGSDAAISGVVTNDQSSTMQTTVTGPGTVAFVWKVSSESGYDFLRFKVDGALVSEISGEQDWVVLTQVITAGTHVLSWTYSKDGSAAEGQDTAWVDTLTAGVPVITSALSATGRVAEAFVYQMIATGNPTAFSAAGLPSGLAIVPATGIINGTPTVDGISSVTLSATNSFGTGTATLQLVVNPPIVGRQVLVGWNHVWKCFQPMGTFPAAAGNFTTTWFAPESTFTSTYTGPTFGATPSILGTPATRDSYDSLSGNGPFGYGTIDYFPLGASEFTAFGTALTTPDSGFRGTAYFRTTFNIPGNALVKPSLRYLIDDGAFLYLDGQLVCTINMPAGATDTYAQLAANAINTETFIYTVDPAFTGAVAGGNAVMLQAITSLATGPHTLAISVRNNSLTSTDMVMALELTAENGAPVPEISVTGGASGTVNIASGETVPNVTNGTDFGTRATGAGPLDTIFHVFNSGSSALNLGTITSSGARFTILPGYASVVAAGANIPVTVRFTPQVGTFTGTISIPSNDSDENPFTFNVTGIGVSGAARQTVVPWNHVWKYYHPMGALPASPGNFLTTWFLSEANFTSTYTGPTFGAVPSVTGNTATTTTYDSGVGPGPLGYDVIDYMAVGGAEFTALGTTLTTPLTANRRTAYFRTTFTVPAGGLVKPQLRYLMDDGGFIYLDGALLCTVNMASGVTDTYTQLAANSTTTEASLRTVDLRTAGAVSGGNAVVNAALNFLAPGVHTLAVSCRSNATNSSDLCLALELTAEPGCAISATAANVVRNDGGNTNGADDTISFTITATGLNTGVNWTSPTANTTGGYGVPVSFTGIPVGNPPAPVIITLTDSLDTTCQTTVTIPLPPVVGRNLISGGTLIFDSRSALAGVTYDEVTPTVTVNQASITPQTQLLTLAGVTGAVRIALDLTAAETSTTSNFETNDLFQVTLILNPGSTQTTVNLLGLADRNADGFLNGFTGTTQQPYDSFPNRDEFNFQNLLQAGLINHTFHFEGTIPDSVTSARVLITMTNDSATETFTLSNFTLSVPVNPDTDNDGLDDSWERAWFGDLSRTGSGDSDADGATNLQESLAGTRPNDPASQLTMQSVSTVGNTQTLLINTVPGRRYRVETSASLSAADWIPQGSVFTATAPTTTRTLTLPAASRVFVRASAVYP